MRKRGHEAIEVLYQGPVKEGSVFSVPVEQPRDEDRIRLYLIYRGMGCEPIRQYEELLATHQVKGDTVGEGAS
jgi:hypothetical protein